MGLHVCFFPLLLLLACVAATASASTSTGESYGQCPVTISDHGDGCAATRSASHHSLGQGATEAEDTLPLSSSNSAITTSSTSGEATATAAAAAAAAEEEEEEASEAGGSASAVSSEHAAGAKDALLPFHSFTCGTTPSATSGHKAAAEKEIGSVILSSTAEGKEASSSWSGDKVASSAWGGDKAAASAWGGDKAVDASATAEVRSAFSSAVEVKHSSSSWAGDKAAAIAGVGGFSCTGEGKEAEQLLGSVTRGATTTSSVEEAVAAAEETATAAHPSTPMGTGAWGTASPTPTTPRSPGAKVAPRPILLAPSQIRISAGTSPLQSLEEMALQPRKRTQKQLVHPKKQERKARQPRLLPSYLSGGLTAVVLVIAILVAAAIIVMKRKLRSRLIVSRTHCNRCFIRPIHWVPLCCRYGYCSHCLALVMMRHHRREWADEPASDYFCTRRHGPMGVVNVQGDAHTFFQDILPLRNGFEREQYPPWFLNDVEEVTEGEETFTVLCFKNIEDCKARKWPKRRRVVFKHVGDQAVERIGEPPVIEYSD